MKLALSLLRRRVSPFACKPWNEASFASFHSMSADPTFLSSTINAVVKIFTSSRNSDFLHPWGSPISGPSSGSGFIIPGRRIITNAHVVTGAIFIRAKKHKSGIMYKAHVQAFGHDCDLAILTIEDDDFWNDVKPLTLLKDLPKLSQILHIVGYPEGGDNICITRVIVSRIDVSVYSHSKGNVQLPTIQLDAAINSGNSGGPVFVDNMVVGVAFQSLVGDNIGYVIPAPIVNLFMTSIEAGKSSVGFCSLDICLQAMDNLTMRDYFQMTKKMSGILVTDVGVSSSDFLEKYDIILEVDGIPVQDDGEVFVNDVGLQLNGYIALKNPREEVSLKVLRKATVINISLNATVGYISSTEDYQIPGYLQYGGFVFTTAYGAVFISQVVEEKAHSAYTSFANMEVCFVNDKIVETLQDISRTVLEGPDYVILGLQQNKVAVIKNPYAQYQIGLHSSASATLESEYGLSGKQAKATLEISLGRPTALERKKFKLEKLLSSRANIDVIPNDEMLMAICEKGYVKRMKADTFNLQHRGSIGKSVGKLRVDDAMSDFLVCHAHDHVLFFSDRGIVYSTRAYKIPECSRNAAGTPLVQISSMSECERVTSIVPVSEFAEDRYLLMLTMNGCIKKVPLKLFSGIRSTGIIAIRLNSGDELKWVRCCSSDDLVAMASQNGMVVLSTCDGVRTLSRNTKGVTAMRLGKEDKMASMDIIPASLQKDMEEKSEDSSTVKQSTGPWLLFVCENGYGKRVPLSSFKCSRLNRVGLIGSEFAEDDRLAAVFVVGYSLSEDGESDEQVVLVSQSGAVNQIKVRDISIQSRTARGVILMRLDHHAGKIQSACLISAADEEETHK